MKITDDMYEKDSPDLSQPDRTQLVVPKWLEKAIAAREAARVTEGKKADRSAAELEPVLSKGKV